MTILSIEIQQHDKSCWIPQPTNFRHWFETCLQHPSLKSNSNRSGYELCVCIVDEVEIKNINANYRQKNNATNVLSFPAIETIPRHVYQQLSPAPLGDIILCPSVIQMEAEQQNKPLINHWAHISIHGLLHLLGFNHIKADEASIMEQLEIDNLAKLAIPCPY